MATIIALRALGYVRVGGATASPEGSRANLLVRQYRCRLQYYGVVLYHYYD
jgi:hypothetical protein